MQQVIRYIAVSACALASAASALGAQTQRSTSRIEFEPFVGIMRDAYDVGADGSRIGSLAGLLVGRRLTPTVRLIGTASYSRAGDVASRTGPSYFVYDNQWVITTAGAEVERGRGRTTLALSGALGAAWRRTVRGSAVGTPPDDGFGRDDWSPTDVVTGSASIRFQMVPRAALVVGARSYVFDLLEGGNRVSPALTVGLALR